MQYREGQAFQFLFHCRGDTDNRAHNTTGKVVFAGKCRQVCQCVVTCFYLLHGLFPVEGYQFGNRVAYVNYQFHGAKGTIIS